MATTVSPPLDATSSASAVREPLAKKQKTSDGVNVEPQEDAKVLKSLQEAVQKSLAEIKPVSNFLAIKSLNALESETSVIEALKLLNSVCKMVAENILSNTNTSNSSSTSNELSSKKLIIQTSLLDVAEFITNNHSELCSKNVETLKLLRPLITEYEALVQKLREKELIDFRAISLFMDNTIGDKKFFPVGPMGSIFRKTKSKAFRAVECSWEEREKIMEKMLNLVPDKRRQFLTAGRSEIRGYKDMSDQELKAWFTFGLEIHDDDE